MNKYPGSKVTFLETPVYSIKSWNQYQYHKDPSIFEQQDQKLQQQIYTLNNKVREINNTLGTHSPEFTSDLSKTDTYRSGTKGQLKSGERTPSNYIKTEYIQILFLLKPGYVKYLNKQNETAGITRNDQTYTQSAWVFHTTLNTRPTKRTAKSME